MRTADRWCRWGLIAVPIFLAYLGGRMPTSEAASGDRAIAAWSEVAGQSPYESLAQAAPLPKTSPPPAAKKAPAPAEPYSSGSVASPPTAPPSGALPSPQQPPPDLFASIFGPNRGLMDRLAGTPNMFGDSLFLGNDLFVFDPFLNTATSELPLAAASSRVKVAENNKAIPQDRIHFMYNHFENAVYSQSSLLGAGPFARDIAVDRYTLGLEKTFACGLWSVEVRMPLAGGTDFEVPGFEVTGGHIGNLAVILKQLIWENDTSGLAIGLAIDTPTGSDVVGLADSGIGEVTTFRLNNQAVHLSPYLGFVSAPSDCLFYHGFVQWDIATNGNSIEYEDSQTLGTLGILNEQDLLYVDLGAGYWLYRNPCARGLTGLATIVEAHYTTTLEDTDLVAKVGFPPPRMFFSNLANRVDVLNLTAGLHTEIANGTICRVGGVFPLRDGSDRTFDAELQVQLERRF